jgi:hypothetical protein
MPRDTSGNYSLPGVYNPVVPGDVITTAWANVTMADIASALTGSYARDGTSPLTGPIYAPSGGLAAPAYSFSTDPSTGFYRSAAYEVTFVANSATIARLSKSSMDLNAPAGAMNLTASTVILAAASDVTLDATDDITITADDDLVMSSGDAMTVTATGALVINADSGLTIKDGGTTILTANATDGVTLPLNALGGFIKATTYTSGSGYLTLNTKTNLVICEAWGGGGGGGGASGTSGYLKHGIGGGGGAYCRGYRSVTSSQLYYSVGSGGSAGSSSGGSGGTGGTSTVTDGGVTIVDADGGVGGAGDTGSVNVGGTGGHDAASYAAGGAANTGNMATMGGGASRGGTIYSPGGGYPTFSNGNGGNSPQGGQGGPGTGIGTNGLAGAAPGGGGGPGVSYGTGRSGGAGGAGRIIIWEFS